ncbi:MAG: OmpA family protein [Lachnospiraceae bacterium]|nr:OmpA family protein [Lachnospiraceae bacterium]
MRAKHKKTYKGHNVWRSYSDMMAGLLLLFVLVMCISFMQAQKNYQERLEEESAHQETTSLMQSQLDEQQALLNEQESELDEQAALLAAQQADLDKQSALVASQQDSLDAQSALLAQQESELADQEALVASQQEALDEQAALVASQQATLEEQQQKIEQIIGVKADLIADLKQEFDAQNLTVTIDETDGSILLDSSVLFGFNEYSLTEEGQELLAQILPVYCSVLLSDEYFDYLAEIRIDGYTDTSGTYFSNLQLSQSRAFAVASYLLELGTISSSELELLEEKLSVNGHSWADPVYADGGSIDADASRRVEIKFSLKDEDMINELSEILNETTAETTAESDTELNPDADTTTADAANTVTAETDAEAAAAGTTADTDAAVGTDSDTTAGADSDVTIIE